MFRVVREVRPTWVVAENVRGLLSWNEGMVLDTVCADLEGEGYEVFPTILPAASVNAPHRRDRIWIVATDSRGMGRQRRGSEETEGREGQCARIQPDLEGQSQGRYAPNPNGQVLEHRDGEGTSRRSTEPPIGTESPCSTRGWETFPTEPPLCGGDDGLPTRLDGITFPKWRKESVKAYGNAIVPQVAYQIFQAIQQS